MQVDDAFVDLHLKPVPRLGALSAGCLPGGDLEALGGHAHRTLHFELRVFSTTNEVRTYCQYQWYTYNMAYYIRSLAAY